MPAIGKPHAYEITIQNFIEKIPLGLALDVKFLKFYFGDAYIGDPAWFTNDYMFPNICLPKFRFKIFVTRRGNQMVLTYKCYCHHTFSLFCQALRSHVVPKWVKMIKSMMDHADLTEPEPKCYVKSFGAYTIYPRKVDDPIFGGSLIGNLYRILTDEAIQGHVNIKRDGHVITITISGIKRVPWTVSSYISVLDRYRQELTKHFKLVVEFYPFIRSVCKGNMQ